MQQNTQLSGLYVITNDEPFNQLIEKLRCIVTFPCVQMIQYRRKKINKQEQFSEAKKIHNLCLEHNIHFIINDDMQLAHKLAEYGSCGVHLGQQDGDIADARILLGKTAIIGRTCHQSVELATQAEQEGASYAAFGAYHPSQSKPTANQLTNTVLEQAQKILNIPICVIGGIQYTDAKNLLRLGVPLISVINGALSGHLKDVEETLNQWQQQFDQYKQSI